MRNLQQLVDSLCKYTPTCVLFILSSLTPFLPPLSLVPPQSVTGGGGGTQAQRGGRRFQGNRIFNKVKLRSPCPDIKILKYILFPRNNFSISTH